MLEAHIDQTSSNNDVTKITVGPAVASPSFIAVRFEGMFAIPAAGPVNLPGFLKILHRKPRGGRTNCWLFATARDNEEHSP